MDFTESLESRMKVLSLTSNKLLQSSKFYLFGIAVGLVAYQLLLTWQIGNNVDQVTINSLFWGAILYLLWGKQDKISLESDFFSSFIGLLLIVLVFFKSISLFWFESSLVNVVPFTFALGLGLLASGVKGLKQYWRELIIAVLLCLPVSLFTPIIDRLFQISQLTTAFAVFILWYTGFDVTRLDTAIVLPQGSAIVSVACTGISTMLLLLKLATIYMLIFPTKWSQKICLVVAAISISFVGGGLRVAIIATVVSNPTAFNYWHGGAGNQIFSTVAIILFGLLCRYLLLSKSSLSQNVAKIQSRNGRSSAKSS
jgi:cyanoexosortase A